MVSHSDGIGVGVTVGVGEGSGVDVRVGGGGVLVSPRGMEMLTGREHAVKASTTSPMIKKSVFIQGL